MKKKIFLALTIILTIIVDVVIAVETEEPYLKILRIDKEGISPNFNKEETEYYITVGMNTNNIEITAIPENPNATVYIKGNKDLEEGINKAEIEVNLNGIKKIYNLNITKTSNIESANTNLENLAIEGITLIPEFNSNITHYKVETNKEKLNILAVPENVLSKIEIENNENLKEGENKIIIRVIAENKITKKEYIIDVNKTNNQTDIEETKIEKISTTIYKDDGGIMNNKIDSKKEVMYICASIVIIGVILIIIVNFKKRKNIISGRK